MKKQDEQRLKELAAANGKTVKEMADILISMDYLNEDLTPTPCGYFSETFDSTGVTTGAPQLLEETETHQILISYFEGNPMKFYKNLSTGAISMEADGVAKALGYENEHDLIGTDESLDVLHRSYKEKGVWPLHKIDSIIQPKGLCHGAESLHDMGVRMRNDVQRNLSNLNTEQLTAMLMKIYDVLDWPCADSTSAGDFAMLQLEKISSEFSAPFPEADRRHIN
jgi:hypothetical protein